MERKRSGGTKPQISKEAKVRKLTPEPVGGLMSSCCSGSDGSGLLKYCVYCGAALQGEKDHHHLLSKARTSLQSSPAAAAALEQPRFICYTETEVIDAPLSEGQVLPKRVTFAEELTVHVGSNFVEGPAADAEVLSNLIES